MTFKTDPETLRVHDPERGLELIRTGGGSDGRHGKALIGAGFRCDFDAYRKGRAANAAERSAKPDIDYTVVWKLSYARPTIPGLTRYETYRLLGEAMLGERLARHDEVNWTVRFPTNLED